MSETAVLTARDAALVDAVAERVVELLIERDGRVSRSHLVTASKLADELGVARSFVYDHADELGAARLGDGPRPTLRFDLEQAREAFSCSSDEKSQDADSNEGGRSRAGAGRKRGRLPHRLPEPGSVLAVRGRSDRGKR
jgi:hypothetical protein